MQTAIITGAGGNLGKAVVKKFLQEKYNVTGTVSSSRAAGEHVPHERLETVAVDLTDEQAAADFVRHVVVRHHHIDVAVCTVGGFAMGNIRNTTSVDIRKQYQLNFETAYHIARPVFEQQLQQGSGHIFLVGSKPGLSAGDSQGMIAYGLSKSLLFRLADMMNEEAGDTHVTVNVIVPSTIDTPENRRSMPDADHSTWVSPEAIAEAIYSRCTPGGAAMHGTVIRMYGRGDAG